MIFQVDSEGQIKHATEQAPWRVEAYGVSLE